MLPALLPPPNPNATRREPQALAVGREPQALATRREPQALAVGRVPQALATSFQAVRREPSGLNHKITPKNRRARTLPLTKANRLVAK